MITKAVLPVAGLGTRFLPASKAIPKEMLPIIDKPLVQYAVEEAIEIGIKEIIFITSPEKYSIEKHFNRNDEIESRLEKSGKSGFIDKLNPKIFSDIKFHYINQENQNGLGHAILQAEKFIGDESFAILLPDDLFVSKKSCLNQLLDIHTNKNSSVIAVNIIDEGNIHNYGVINPGSQKDAAIEIDDIIEKPMETESIDQNQTNVRFAVVGALLQKLKENSGKKQEKIFSSATKYLSRFENPEFVIFFVKQSINMERGLLVTKTYTDFSLEHTDVNFE